ncbi:MFS transporter [Actinophytocola xanthii]|uniref:MFS transporter n=1 Tax=Actinophytocola xanthii TaxID=1912961 RepID=A0A1Q8CPA3_9PSEU|nr:MFS transporter [Actinophytocola xanthii]OLF16193.1 MFS transporter [Actinophytocola xanthii]
MVDTRHAPRRVRPSLAPLATRGFRYLVAAEAVSEFGNAFTLVALPWLVYELGGGAGQLGLVVAAFGVGRLATTPLGGLCTDRFGAWRVMLVSDVGRALLTAALAVVAGTGTGSVVVVGALAAGVGLFAGVFQPAAWAITPSLLPAEQLSTGMSLTSTVAFAAGLAGPGVAGLLVAAADPAAGLAVDAATFAVSSACLVAVGRELRGPAPGGDRPAEASGGFFALLRASGLLRDVLLVTVVANLTVGGLLRVCLPALAEEDLAAGVVGLGGLLAAFTAGCLAGGLVAAGASGVRRRGAAAMASGLVMAAGVLAVPFVGLWGAVAALFVAGAASTVTNVFVVTVVQLGTPAALLGRVMAAILFCGIGLFPVSVALTGFVVESFGVTVVLVTTTGLLAAAFLFGLSRREITSR